MTTWPSCARPCWPSHSQGPGQPHDGRRSKGALCWNPTKRRAWPYTWMSGAFRSAARPVPRGEIFRCSRRGGAQTAHRHFGGRASVLQAQIRVSAAALAGGEADRNQDRERTPPKSKFLFFPWLSDQTVRIFLNIGRIFHANLEQFFRAQPHDRNGPAGFEYPAMSRRRSDSFLVSAFFLEQHPGNIPCIPPPPRRIFWPGYGGADVEERFQGPAQVGLRGGPVCVYRPRTLPGPSSPRSRRSASIWRDPGGFFDDNRSVHLRGVISMLPGPCAHATAL